MKKKIISLLLALTMIAGLTSALAFAEEPEDFETQDIVVQEIGDEVYLDEMADDKAYLETDVLSTVSERIRKFPSDGNFVMGGVTYTRGIRTWYNYQDGTASYNIDGKGYTRLAGKFGRIDGDRVGQMIVRADNIMIGAYTTETLPKDIEVAIPAGTKVISISLAPDLGTGSNGNIAFADAYFDKVTSTKPPEPKIEPGAVYLENGIFAVQSTRVRNYPSEGSFVMGAVRYYRGFRTQYNYQDSTATYNIKDQGFTRLKGMFGRIDGDRTGRMIISADGIMIGAYITDTLPKEIEVAIPAGTEAITIWLTPDLDTGAMGNIAFADAFFDKGNVTQKPEPEVITDAVYLENGISSIKDTRIIKYPANGSVTMQAVRYYRGIQTQYNYQESTASYNIEGKGFTKLVGMFGRLGGDRTGKIEVTGDGVLIGEYNTDILAKEIEFIIPAGVKEIAIKLTPNLGSGSNGNIAFLDAYFIKTSETPPPPPPPPPPSGDPIEDFVTRLYRIVMGREPDAQGLALWKQWLASGEQTGASAAYGFFFSTEMNSKTLGNDEFATLLYRALLGRDPDASELAGWLAIEVPRGYTLRGYLFYIAVMSKEFSELCQAAGIDRGDYWADTTDNIEGYVQRTYNLCLGRIAANDEMQDWVNKLNSGSATGSSIVLGFTNSQEFLTKGLDNPQYVEVLYKVFLGRASDEGGRADWLGRLATQSRDQVLLGIAGSHEFKEICDGYGIRP